MCFLKPEPNPVAIDLTSVTEQQSAVILLPTVFEAKLLRSSLETLFYKINLISVIVQQSAVVLLPIRGQAVEIFLRDFATGTEYPKLLNIPTICSTIQIFTIKLRR